MQGFEDPLNRGAYPWGAEDQALQSWYRLLGQLRCRHSALRRGDLIWLFAQGGCMAFRRQTEEESLLSVLNAGEKAVPLTLSWHGGECRDLISGHSFPVENGFLSLDIPPRSGYLLL